MKKSRSEVTDWTAARPTPVDTGQQPYTVGAANQHRRKC